MIDIPHVCPTSVTPLLRSTIYRERSSEVKMDTHEMHIDL